MPIYAIVLHMIEQPYNASMCSGKGQEDRIERIKQLKSPALF